MISSGLPEDYVLESFHPTAFCLGIWDSSSEGEPELGKNFWLDFSSSDEEEVKGMTRSVRFYSDVADKGKETLTDGREVLENTENVEGDVVLRQLRKTRAQVSI